MILEAGGHPPNVWNEIFRNMNGLTQINTL